eukprot:TRINITY_DN7304_c0_g1_i1.p1 TRINITY_DN7304_c0_g1~~TRINITY_DN7304_c0_g1_i1.p1  ORF type:complete len:321 (-),score=105.04 TRINITY_DN7304_c0_g1_i1:99-950(-)
MMFFAMGEHMVVWQKKINNQSDSDQDDNNNNNNLRNSSNHNTLNRARMNVNREEGMIEHLKAGKIVNESSLEKITVVQYIEDLHLLITGSNRGAVSFYKIPPSDLDQILSGTYKSDPLSSSSSSSSSSSAPRATHKSNSKYKNQYHSHTLLLEQLQKKKKSGIGNEGRDVSGDIREAGDCGTVKVDKCKVSDFGRFLVKRFFQDKRKAKVIGIRVVQEKWVVTITQKNLCVWDVESLSVLKNLEGKMASLCCFCVEEVGRGFVIVVGERVSKWSGQVIVWHFG